MRLGRVDVGKPGASLASKSPCETAQNFLIFSFLSAPPMDASQGARHPRADMQSLKQLQTADRSARASMKNAANCVNQCELQDTLIIDVSNAHGGLGSLPGPRPVEGRLLPLRDFAVSSSLVMGPRLGRFLAACSRGRLGFRIDPVRDAV